MRGLRLKSSFLVLPENRVIGFVLLPIRPAELGKTTNTTFTTSNNLRAVARIALLLQGKQQNTTLRQDITPGEISRKCVQGEALFIVVSIAASLMSAWASKRRLSPRSVVSCCKSCSSCFPCVHVASLHFPEEPLFCLSDGSWHIAKTTDPAVGATLASMARWWLLSAPGNPAPWPHPYSCDYRQ